MKLSFNGYIDSVFDGEIETIVTLKIPRYMSKHFTDLDKSKKYNLSVTEVRKRRTLEQNDIAWGVMREIARNSDIEQDVELVYKQILEHANIKSTFLMTTPEAVKELSKVFRVVIDHGERNNTDKSGNHLHTYECLYGMSKFSRKEMSRFIESLMYFAEHSGVDTNKFERW